VRVRILALVGFALVAILLLLRSDPDRSRPIPGDGIVPEVPSEAAPASPPDSTIPAASPPGALSAPLPPPVDLERADRDLDLHGRVVDAAGVPVPGAAIECIHRPGRRTEILDLAFHREAIVEAQTASAEDGTFSIRLARGDLRELRVLHPSYAETTVPGCQAGERVEIVLHPGAILVLRAVDESGAPVPDVRARLRYLELEVFIDERTLSTDEEGAATFVSLPPGTVSIFLEHDTLASPLWSSLDIVAGSRLEHEAVMTVGRTIHGTVLDRESGRPIAGALVGEGWTMRRAVSTDAFGRYEVVGLAGSGRRDLVADAIGYGRGKRSIEAGDTGPIDFELAPGDVVVGTVVDATGVPIGGARVHAVASVGRYIEGRHDVQTESRVASTGADGAFRIDSLHPDWPHTLIILARGAGRTLIDIDGTLRGPGSVIDLGTIELAAARAIEGEVVDGDGRPIPRVAVLLQGENEDRRRYLSGEKTWSHSYGRTEPRRTDDLGRFRFPDLAPGEYRIGAAPRGSPEASTTVRLGEEDEETRFVRIVIASGAGLAIEVRAEEGEPVAGATIRVSGDFLPSDALERTDDEGIARFRGLAGPLRVTITAPRGFLPATGLELEAQGQTERIVLRRSARISGSVVSSDGSPLGGMLVVAIEPGSSPEIDQGISAFADPDGAFEILVPAGRAVDLLCPGTRQFTAGERRGMAWSPHLGSLRGIVPPAEGLVLRLDEIARDRALAVRVVGPDGTPFEGVGVFVKIPPPGLASIAQTLTESGGVARFADLPATEVEIACKLPATPAPGNSGWIEPEPVTLVPDGQEIVLTLRLGTHLAVTVVDGGGATVPGAVVRAVTSTGRRIHSSVEEGPIAIFLLPGETADLTVSGRVDGIRCAAEAKAVPANAGTVRLVLEER